MSALVLVGALLAASPAYQSVKLDGFPFVKQKPDFCGEADVEMALRRLGRDVTQDDVFALSGVDPLAGRGAWTNELATALRALGIEPGRVWHRVDPAKAGQQVEAQWAALHRELLLGQPSIVCMHYDFSPDTTEHFRLVTGYDAAKDEVIYQEPAEDHGADRRMARGDFFKLWTFKPAKDRWTLIRFSMAPVGPGAKPEREPPPTRADVSQHVQELKKTLPRGFTLAWEKPFLVVGNEEPAKVRARAKDVVGWATALLLKDFFAEAPGRIEEAWLFGDARSYEKASRELFKVEPDTPYGYYLSGRRAMVMNIKPGYGTLTHEMVHPFFHQAWPAGPAWLNEGLGSLFERPAERDGHLVGKVNWRLPGLLAALRAGRAPSFRALVHFDADTFYEDPVGAHYAAARYLCYWLQEKGLLVQFVRRAQALKDQDPTGWRALTEVLGKDPDAFRPEWERFVKGLDGRS